jgi:hypothetical protein
MCKTLNPSSSSLAFLASSHLTVLADRAPRHRVQRSGGFHDNKSRQYSDQLEPACESSVPASTDPSTATRLSFRRAYRRDAFGEPEQEVSENWNPDATGNPSPDPSSLDFPPSPVGRGISPAIIIPFVISARSLAPRYEHSQGLRA